MNVAFVLGNGRSRLSVDPYQLKNKGPIYACNAIYRDIIPDYLIAVDTKMILELVEKNVNKQTQIWTNPGKHKEDLPDINFLNPSKGWSSGPTALWMASTHGHKEIFILGFDYHGEDSNTKFNNVYADTRNYKKSSEAPTFFGNWLNQTEQVIKEFTETKYYRVIDPGQFIPPWDHLQNLEHIDYETFKTKVNYQNSQF